MIWIGIAIAVWLLWAAIVGDLPTREDLTDAAAWLVLLLWVPFAVVVYTVVLMCRFSVIALRRGAGVACREIGEEVFRE